MESLQSHRVEMISIAVALVAIGAGTAFYFYITKKPKGILKFSNLSAVWLILLQKEKNSFVGIGCLDPDNFKEYKLVKRTELSHNVAKFKFALPTPNSVLGLPIGQHMSCRGKDSVGEEVVKPYTPTTLDSDIGYFELVIKMYPQGRMSHHFREMREGDYMAVKGPKGRFKYQPNQVRAFGMIAGGTGITPMFQEEIDNLATIFPSQFNIYYVLNQILRCGPPPMNKAMAAHLNDLGYTSQMQFQF
ncbi:hypothetical protein SADUNF_Sadunf09G0126200 [Salix dunnii]|uniref:cytochrome-b5 reductase n=1 Tax=Salix dunnii TaxID=1413687 RepID=A0A835JU97_9ROSI|nr:hypothetical protein SADUNF_Sadunf09G0126200 [Salix dunnii]